MSKKTKESNLQDIENKDINIENTDTPATEDA